MRRITLLFVPVLLILCGLVLQGCGSQPAPPPPTPDSSVPPVTARIVSPKTGKTYSYVHVPDSDDEFEKFEPPSGLAPAGPDNFTGTARKAAKTSISKGPTQTFTDMPALFSSGLFLPDSQMTNHHPKIADTATSDRVKEEQHNVVVTAYLYASSKEPDNDFHCIFGAAPGQPVQLLNVEISGLPQSGAALAQLTTVRNNFKAFFGAGNLPGSGYDKFNPPIPVKITGSIFFDIDHPGGVVGPVGMRPVTAWEIHPVTGIEFEP